MVDTRDLKSLASRRAGSSPAPGTKMYAHMAKLVDAPDLGSGLRVGVRVPLCAPKCTIGDK
jgi:hypothetical protein